MSGEESFAVHTTASPFLQTASQLAATAHRLYKRAPRSTRILQSLRPYICPFEELIRWFPERGQVLDVGCGAGLFLGLIGCVRPNLCGIGFDMDSRSIAAAQQMALEHFPDLRIRFDHSSVSDPWPAAQFDVVSMIDVLHHIPPEAQRGAIRQACSHVRPGGLFVYKDMANRPFFRASWNRLHDLLVAQQWIHYRAIEEVEVWLREMGAEIVENSSRNIGLYGHETVIARRLV